jgi:peptidyl-prolyl cis-trans isomerase D
LKAKQAQRKFAEVAETFSNGVYEQADSLKPVADRLKLELKTATYVQRTVQPGATGVLANPKFLTAVFSADSVEKKRNTEAVEIGTNQMVSARITQYTPARTLPLAEVRASVREILVAQQAAALAVKEGTAKLAAWKAAGTASDLPAAVILSREQKQPIRGALLDAAMSADASTLPTWVGVDLGAQGYAVVRVNKVLARTPPAAEVAKQERVQYTQWMAGAENLAYYELLKDRLKVQMKVQRPVSPVFGSAAAK